MCVQNEVRCEQLKEVVSQLERKLQEAKSKIKDLTIHAIESKKDNDGRERQQIMENQKLRETNTKVVKQLKFERHLRKVNSSSQTSGAPPSDLKTPEALRGAEEKRLPSARVAFQEARRAQVKLQEKQRENRRLKVAFDEQLRENGKAVEYWKRKYKRLQIRRDLEFQGWRTDIDNLSQQLQQLQAVWSSQLQQGHGWGGGVRRANFSRLRHNLKSPNVDPQKLEKEFAVCQSALQKMAERFSVKLQKAGGE